MSNLDRLVEQTLYFVAQKGWARSREGFFTALVTFLGEQLGVEYALVDELLPGKRRARTVGLYASGTVVPDMEYELRGTPCENVMGKTLCWGSTRSTQTGCSASSSDCTARRSSRARGWGSRACAG